jgi:1-deoxy-D-xylulose-5-phosphate reductoisomerase
VWSGLDGVCRLASLPGVHTVVISITGSIALLPLLEAIKANKKIALANKEALVVAGHIVNDQLSKNKKAQIVPIDSEQNAIFQCLKGYERRMINCIYLTASGGPLLDCNRDQLQHVTPEQALSHPRWKMGRKITIDSATLMNKGLEVIEAKWLFNMPLDKIKVIIHKEAIIHSLVEFIDGSILGQLAVTDMKLPIQYALSFPERWQNNGQLRLDFAKLKSLTFGQPDFSKFPCLELAYYAASKNNMLPCVLNAANEEAVGAFLSHRIAFNKIPQVIEQLLKRHKNIGNSNKITDLLELDRAARLQAQELIGRIQN